MLYLRVEGGGELTPERKAEYMKKRRVRFKAFHVEVEKERMEHFEKHLEETKQTKKEWLERRISEDIGQ